jgi:hypothetical protein
MELSRLSLSENHFFFSTPIPPSSLSHHRLPTLLSLCTNRRSRRNLCSASNSDTLVAATGKKRNEDDNDLKTWMHKNGLPPCKVVLKDKPSHDDSHKPIHYVAASEDLQVCLFHSCVFISLFSFSLFMCFNLLTFRHGHSHRETW